MTVVRLPSNGREPAGQRRRPRLAELHARNRSLAAEIAALQTPQAEREAALLALPAALEAHRTALQDHDLDGDDGASLQGARDRVLSLRATIASASDHSAKIAALHGEHARLSEAISAETATAILAEVTSLCAEYQAASKRALTAQAALDGLAVYGRAMADPGAGGALLIAIVAATRLHPDGAESALRSDKLKAVLGDVARVWSAFPRALAVDPDAMPAPLSEAVAMLPVRDEEEGERHDAA